MKYILFCAIVVFSNTCLLAADVIGLMNGDRLSGEIQGLISKKLTFQTAYAGTIEIAWDQIRTLSTVKPLLVKFGSGSSAIGLISSPEPGTLQLDHTAPVPLSQVIAIHKESNASQTPTFLASWAGSANLGYTFIRGNTTIDNLAVNFQPERETTSDRIRILAQAFYNVQDDIEASSTHSIQGRYDRFLRPGLFLFVNALAETDEREQLDLRTSGGGGFGMDFVLGRVTQLSVFSGLTFLQENFKNLNKTRSAEGIAGVEIESERFEPLVVGTTAQLLPILTGGRYRVQWSANIRIPLFVGFNLGLQMFDNFDSHPPQVDVKKNDFGIVSTLGYSF